MDRSARPVATTTTASRGRTSPCRTFPWATQRTAAVSITSSSNSSSPPPSVRRMTMMAARATLQNLRAQLRAAHRRHIRRRPRCCRYTSTRAWDRRRATTTPLAAAAAAEARGRLGDPGDTGVTTRAPARAGTRTSKTRRRRRRRRRESRFTRSPSRKGRGGARTPQQLGPAARPRERCRPGGSDPTVAGGHPPSCHSSMTMRAARAPARVRMTSPTNCPNGEPTVGCGYRM